ncbi:MAG: HEAT repeat domain-containing protein, partial [Anaerolineae bacterium]|nr:HEAT repeat domain-containing protein [Anaerolineae bacterium]
MGRGGAPAAPAGRPGRGGERPRGGACADSGLCRSPLGRKSRILVTSRPAGYTRLGDFAEFTLKPLQGREEARAFLESWLHALRPEWDAAHQAQTLVERLEAQPALRNLLDNPLILRLAAYQYARTGEVARNRAALYAAYLEEAWERAVRRMVPAAEREAWRRQQEIGVQQVCFAAAEALAWHFHTDGKRDEPSARQALVQLGAAHDEAEAQGHLEWLRTGMGLVVQAGGELVFSHTTFREYLVARRLQRAWERDAGRTWKFLRPRLHLPAWREPLQLVAAALPPAQAEALLRRVLTARSPYEHSLHRDLFRAAELAGAGALIPPRLREEMRQRLSRALRDENWRVRWAAAKALGKLGDAQAVPALLAALQDEDWRVRVAAAEALGKLGDAQAVPALIAALRDEDADMRRAAVEALGKLGDAQAVPALLAAL